MTTEQLLELYPTSFYAAMLAGIWAYFLIRIVVAIVRIPEGLLKLRYSAARCIGFHSGSIAGSCHCHSCPNRIECMHYQDNRRLTRWIRQLRAKKKDRP